MFTLLIILLFIALLALLPYIFLAGIATWLVTSWWFWIGLAVIIFIIALN